SSTSGSPTSACLPGSREEAGTAARCLTQRWGELGAGKEELAARLQQAEISLLSHEDCAKYWEQNIEETNICRRASKVAFWMVCRRHSVNAVLHTTGTQSHGSDKCHPESPTTYSRVCACRHWISSVTN
ncbi:CTRA protein, partial [Rhynochetos jubatus]|nr:CTRA protein [Rhynochetos jubatus]